MTVTTLVPSTRLPAGNSNVWFVVATMLRLLVELPKLVPRKWPLSQAEPAKAVIGN